MHRNGNQAVLVIALLAFTAEVASAGNADGMICLAPFHVETPVPGEPPSISGPLMSATTWPPSYDSRFTFHIDGRLRATIANHEMAKISGLPTNRRVRVKVMLDGLPFETFSLQPGKQQDYRICLWLYPDYWHWIDNGWSERLGCKC